MRDAGLLAGVDKTALRLDHVLRGGRNHQHAIDTIEGRAKRLRPPHIALGQLDAGKSAEPCRGCPVKIANQRPHLMPLPRELAHDCHAVQAGGACHQDHLSLHSELMRPPFRRPT